MRCPSVLAVLALCALAAPAAADTVIFKTGQQVEGTVTDRGDRIEVKILEGVMTYRKDLIREIRKSVSAVGWYDAESAKVSRTDPAARFRLALDCAQRRLHKPALVELRAVLQIDRGHAGAHALLRDQFVNGQWIGEDEAMRARGYVRADPKGSADEDVKWHVEETIKQVDGALRQFGTAPTTAARADAIVTLAQLQAKYGMAAGDIAGVLAKAPGGSLRTVKLPQAAELTAQTFGDKAGKNEPDQRWITAEHAAKAAQLKQLEDAHAARARMERQRAYASQQAAAAEQAAADARAAADRATADAASRAAAEKKALEAARRREQESWGRYSICGTCRGKILEGDPYCQTCPPPTAQPTPPPTPTR